MRAWLDERVVRSLPLLLALAAAMALVGGPSGLLFRTAAALLAVIAFRLWDDVEDVAHDRAHHPDRVLCGLPSLRAPRLAWQLLLALSGASLLAVGGSIAPFVTATALVACAYLGARRRRDPRLRALITHVVLLKAPLVALALAPSSTPLTTALARALALHGLVGLYELGHDAEARRSPHALALALLDLASLGAGLAIAALR
jgi:4-hydroxybenzoate polyprenyltransferase